MLANLMHRKITASRENLTLGYFVAGCGETLAADLHSWYREQLLTARDGDINRGSTAVGPHRDDLILKVNDKDLRNFGSQGQQRTSILALKLAELEFLMSETGEYPVLLLDDVMSELDRRRREQLLLFIHDRIQTFITATDRHAFPDTISGRYYQVTAGKVAE
jgi:DNA replication and repair protein RecF